jgi:hypothetical protein
VVLAKSLAAERRSFAAVATAELPEFEKGFALIIFRGSLLH